jgi:hypothetical protein
MKWTNGLFVFCLLVACAPVVDLPTLIVPPSPVTQLIVKLVATPHPALTRAPTFTPEPTSVATDFVLTSDPYLQSQYTIQALHLRKYGGGEVEGQEILD